MKKPENYHHKSEFEECAKDVSARESKKENTEDRRSCTLDDGRS